jgi:hypothetical protein
MKEQQELIDQKFSQIIKQANNQEQKRPPAKFPELRYLWGITLLGSFILIVIGSVVTTIIESANPHTQITRDSK